MEIARFQKQHQCLVEFTSPSSDGLHCTDQRPPVVRGTFPQCLACRGPQEAQPLHPCLEGAQGNRLPLVVAVTLQGETETEKKESSRTAMMECLEGQSRATPTRGLCRAQRQGKSLPGEGASRGSEACQGAVGGRRGARVRLSLTWGPFSPSDVASVSPPWWEVGAGT